MTLITNPTRVHFADDVLQEALQSELERAQSRSPLLIVENTLADSELSDRIHAALPYAMRPSVLTFKQDDDLRDRVAALADLGTVPDSIIAFGSARAIELSRKCRYALSQTHRKRPLLFAVPGVDGLPNPCTRNIESWRAGLPTVLICDPTVALGADQRQSSRAVIVSMVRCVESYLATAFNPPADGMALDGLSRCAKLLPRKLDGGSLTVQREVMAAGLNAAFSQEKGIGPATVLAWKLTETAAGLDEVELAQLVFTSTVKTHTIDKDKADTLLNVLGGNSTSLETAFVRLLKSVPPPRSLSDLGLNAPLLDAAASGAAGHAGLSYDSARALLETIY